MTMMIRPHMFLYGAVTAKRNDVVGSPSAGPPSLVPEFVTLLEAPV